MQVHDSVLDAVGDTPLVRLRRVTAGLAAQVWIKLEVTNPGGSVKDRAALAMVRAAEADGSLRPGGTIVEGTSGNTGVGLAVVAAQRGYGVVVVVPDTIAGEKVALLRAYGARVVTTIGKLPREHPDHLKNLARRIAAETDGGWLANQYDNPANPLVHEHTTGPEILEQTGGRVTHLVAGIGTGGTITGAGRFLKAHGVTVVAADPETSVYAGGDGSPYFVESIGHYLHPDTVEDPWPLVYDRSVIDRFERIPDGESLRVTRRLAREEGLLLGGSAGTAVAAALRVAAELGPEDVVVAVAPDSGHNYLSKYFDDGWMGAMGFLDAPDVEGAGPRVRDLVPGLDSGPGLAVAPVTATVADVLAHHRDGLVALVVARPSDSPTRSAPEVLGVVSPAQLRGRDGTEPAREHATSPAAVGHGESAAAALERIGRSGGPVLVLVDGRGVALVPRAALEQPPAPSG